MTFCFLLKSSIFTFLPIALYLEINYFFVINFHRIVITENTLKIETFQLR